MRRACVAAWVFVACVEALPGDDRVDAGTRYLRLLRPRTGATVFARRPLLRWYRDGVTAEVRIDLCADRACGRVLQSWDDTAGSSRVPRALPAGVVFWRVRPRRGGAVASWGSPTGWFVVAAGARDGEAPDSVDQRPASQIDVDGDGLADVVLPDGTIFRSAGERFEASPYGRLLFANGAGAVSAGDVNGDGFLDVAVADARSRPGGVLHLYLGPLPRGVVAPRRQLTCPDGPGRTFGPADSWADAPSGDVNGDGFDDLVVASANNDESSSRVYLFLGGASGSGHEPGPVFDASLSRRTLLSAASPVDLDGDGFDEALFTNRSLESTAPGFEARVGFVYRGTPSGLEAPAARTWTASGLGPAAALADVDGSGHGAVVVYQTDCLGVLREPLSGDGPAAAERVGCEGNPRRVGAHLETGDVDGDGRADILASAEAGAGFVNLLGARLYRPPTVAGGEWRASALEPPADAERGLRRFGLADVNGDGVMDAITWADASAGSAAYVHRGGPGGLSPRGERVNR